MRDPFVGLPESEEVERSTGIAMVRIIQFAALLFTALSMGVHFGTWLTERPLRRTQSGALFIEVHQERDRVAARVMPILGTAALVFLALAVFHMRAAPAAFALSLTGLVLCVGDALVTAFVNVPINREVQGFALFSASVVLFDNS